ncbi:MBL fold metallo-hydrolase [Paraferrimonas sedimenticola]|uniref:Hydrolase n=1 Tax=Paraferrimonas sedimenticola TaxID=375674 RepID=A0AA37RTE0_9GAMM|nr:MBL fold metallo-hydrolase [Paraferrimonas sedimenticola]GLP95118.1 hydrolase [Paraferrimonas sedimenticola]
MSQSISAQSLDHSTLHHNVQGFQNVGMQPKQAGSFFGAMKTWLTAERNQPKPQVELPVHSIDMDELQATEQDRVYRLGHSSMLLKLDGQLILLDPVFSERASPVSFAGPKRFHPAPTSLEQLPYIDWVMISHDHYDHLDKASIKALKNKVGHFVVPLRVGDYLRDWGVADDKIVELDWWQSFKVNGIEVHATPTQHFSGRCLLDRNQTLWASYVIQSSRQNIYFSGDSGYFDGFKAIGERFGPFDLAMVETGAYSEQWADIHMLPEQSVQAAKDLQAKAMLPIHNSTFDLAMHDWYEPLERARTHAAALIQALVTPEMGQGLDLSNLPAQTPWWHAYMPAEAQTTGELAVSR